MVMYRKSQSSAKYSRNERLAQLSEQESVIEKKKREILAKVEAQKKKETEAFAKLEQSNSQLNVRKDNILTCNDHQSGRGKDVEEEKQQVKCLRNVFSNDGSFLDKFKKLSSSMSKKEVNFLTPSNVTESMKIFDSKEKSEINRRNKNVILDNYERRQCKLNEGKEISYKNVHNSNVQYQLQPFELDEPLPNHQEKAAPSTMSNSQVQTKPPKSAMYKRNVNLMSDASLSPLVIAVKPAEAEDSQAENSFLAHTPPTANETYQPRSPNTHVGSSLLNITEISVRGNERKKIKSDNEERLTQFHDNQKSRIISSSNSCSRVSPALTGLEEKNRNENHLRDALCQDQEKTVISAQIQRCRGSPIIECEPDGLLKKEGNADQLGMVEEMLNLRRTNKDPKCDSTDSESSSRDSYQRNMKFLNQIGKEENIENSDGYQANCDNESIYNNGNERQKKSTSQKSTTNDFPICKEGSKSPERCGSLEGAQPPSKERSKRKRKSRWGDEIIQGNSANVGTDLYVQLPANNTPVFCGKTPMLSKLTRSDPGLIQYAKQAFGSTNLNEEDWKKAEDHYKINLLYQDMVKKRAEIDKLEKAGKFKYEYDSDEDVEGGTWEHKLRQQEMLATQLWAEELTRQAAGKHHIGDFLPPEELERFMEKYNAVKQGRNPDLSDYKEFKLKEDNVGYRLLQKMGWNEGQGLGQDGNGITIPINKASSRHDNQGLGVDRPDGLQAGDDEYDAYRKRMMLAYRFRPNPLNNPRRPYY